MDGTKKSKYDISASILRIEGGPEKNETEMREGEFESAGWGNGDGGAAPG